MKSLQCVILCGGRGTRLGALTAATPKPLLIVGAQPFLETLIFELGRQGFRRVLLLAAFQSELIEHFAAGSPAAKRFGIAISIAREPDQAGTGGALWHARDQLEDEFFLLNGDTWFDIPMLSLSSAFHTDRRDPIGAIALRGVPDISRYGSVTLKDGLIVKFAEKSAEARAGYVNGGVYFFRNRILDHVTQQCSLENDTLTVLAEQGSLVGLPYEDDYFIDIGIPETYARSQIEIPARHMRPAVFLDRDGVLNEDLNYVGSIDRVRFVAGAAQAVARLNRLGYYVFVVTNQAGIGRGYFTEDEHHAVMAHISEHLASHGAHYDDHRYCAFHSEATVEAFRADRHPWRKPEPGMLLDLMDHWSVDKQNSFIIGDKDSDIVAGERAGIEGYLFSGGDLNAFVATILNERMR